ncbi:hypothetical protein FO519_005067 [Halicephalobus sp. NKZ332]|nr:hypothetical protein FO519_005067 [Halicephalobus sp. NKZ332]
MGPDGQHPNMGSYPYDPNREVAQSPPIFPKPDPVVNYIQVIAPPPPPPPMNPLPLIGAFVQMAGLGNEQGSDSNVVVTNVNNNGGEDRHHHHNHGDNNGDTNGNQVHGQIHQGPAVPQSSATHSSLKSKSQHNLGPQRQTTSETRKHVDSHSPQKCPPRPEKSVKDTHKAGNNQHGNHTASHRSHTQDPVSHHPIDSRVANHTQQHVQPVNHQDSSKPHPKPSLKEIVARETAKHEKFQKHQEIHKKRYEQNPQHHPNQTNHGPNSNNHGHHPNDTSHDISHHRADSGYTSSHRYDRDGHGIINKK